MTTAGKSEIDEWTRYRRTAVAEMRDLRDGEDVASLMWAKITVSHPDAQLAPEDFAKGKIARNPDNHADQWYISADYFAKNFAAIGAVGVREIAKPGELTALEQQLHDVRNALSQLPLELQALRFTIGEDLPPVSVRALHRVAALRLEEMRLNAERARA